MPVSVIRWLSGFALSFVALSLGSGCGNDPALDPPASESEAVVTGNLVPDPGLESGLSGFTKQSSSDSLSRSTSNPISGSASLLTTLNSWGSNVWWQKIYGSSSTVTTDRVTVSARVRALAATSGSPMQICAVSAYVDNGAMFSKCVDASPALGQTSTVTAVLPITSNRRINQASMKITLQGSKKVTYQIDNVSVSLGAGTAPSPSPSPSASPTASPSPTATPSPTPTPTGSGTPVNLSAAWANNGEDKVTRDGTRASSQGANSVLNSVWNGEPSIRTRPRTSKCSSSSSALRSKWTPSITPTATRRTSRIG